MSKKGKHAAHADERWLLTYADMITLLMALFIVMFAISVVNKGKFAQLAESLKKSFSGDIMSGQPSILSTGSPNFSVQSASSPSQAAAQAIPEVSQANQDAPATAAARQALNQAAVKDAQQTSQLQNAKHQVDQKIAQLGMQAKVVTQVDERGLVIRLVTDDVLFDQGSAEVRPTAYPLLRVVASAIEPLPLPIHVEGHTDATPFQGDPYGNFKLSIDRGKNVAVFLLENGVDPLKHAGDVTGTGYGAYRPLPGVAPTDARNRRVEIVIVRRDFVTEARKASAGPLGANPAGVEQIAPATATSGAGTASTSTSTSTTTTG